MANQPIVFNIQYTPYRLKSNATQEEKDKHTKERAYYDMTGGKNIYKYITTEGKRVGKFTALEYLQKSTGVFNDKGMLSKEKVTTMKARLAENKGNIWHGFISLSEEESHKIDNPDKCVNMIKRTFNAFLKDCHFPKDNIDLMCALHLDKPHHLHIHFVFWEKEGRYQDRSGNMRFRNKGKIEKKAIDNMFVRLGLYIDDDKDKTYKTRDNAIRELRALTDARRALKTTDDIKKAVINLAKDLPKTGRLSYDSEDMRPYRKRVDNIVKMLLDYDWRTKKLDKQFYKTLDEKRVWISNICGAPFLVGENNKSLPNYHNTINETNTKIADKIEYDYKRRQGNLVLNLAKFIKPELYERKKDKKYKANDIALKRNLNMSAKKVGRIFDDFIVSFFSNSQILVRDTNNRLKEIEKEMEEEKKKEQK